MTGPLRQSTFGHLDGYEDVNDADRLERDPAMRWIVGGHAVAKQAASASQMGRFETAFLELAMTTSPSLPVCLGPGSTGFATVNHRRI